MFPKTFLPLLTVGFSLAWLILINGLNEIPPDSGDGIMHFFIAQASWENPLLFLDHWGKPLFTLLSSPFAQFGFQGIIVFQLFVFSATCLIGFKILEKLNCASSITSLLPLLLVLTNDYVTTVLSALTEPLFNLFVVGCLYLLLNKKWLLFAIFLSFTPYLRSEGQLCIVIGIVMLILNKQYIYIPFIFSGFLIYSVIGYLSLTNFWWYFTENPYHLSNDIYGKGTWYHYLVSYKNYLGNHGLLLLILSVILVIRKRKDFNTLELHCFLFSFAIFFGILTAHSYFWATGQNGSIGLTRITTQGLPLVLICCLFIISKYKAYSLKLNTTMIEVGFLVTCLFFLINTKKWPIEASGIDLDLVHTALFLETNSTTNQTIFYHHPLLALKMKANPLLKKQRLNFHYGHNLDLELNSTIKKGDILVWDSHFGPREAGIPFEKIQNNPKLTSIKQFNSNKDERVHVYQHQDTNLRASIQYDTLLAYLSITLDSKEFYDILSIPKKDSKATIEIVLENLATACHIVCTNEPILDYQSISLKKGKVKLRFDLKAYTNYKIYVWNPDKKHVKLSLSELVLISDKFPAIQTKR